MINIPKIDTDDNDESMGCAMIFLLVFILVVLYNISTHLETIINLLDK